MASSVCLFHINCSQLCIFKKHAYISSALLVGLIVSFLISLFKKRFEVHMTELLVDELADPLYYSVLISIALSTEKVIFLCCENLAFFYAAKI